MKKVIITLALFTLAFGKPHDTSGDYVYGIYKVGDKRTSAGKWYQGVKDGMLIEVIDPAEWPVGKLVISDNMQRVFCVIKHRRDWKTTLREASMSYGNIDNKNEYRPKHKKIDFKTLGNSVGIVDLDWRLRSDSILLIDGTNLDESILETTVATPSAPLYVCYDYNAITSGSATVGSGGDYATFSTALADLGNLTGDVTFTQISDVVETTTGSITEELAGNTLTLSSNTYHGGDYNNGHLLTMQHNVHMFLLGQELDGVVDICCLKVIRTVVPNSETRAFINVANISTGSQTIRVYDNMHNGDQGGRMFASTDATPVIQVYNNISWAGYSGIYIDVNDGNANSVFENNTFYAHTVAGITANAGGGGFGTYRNNVCIDNIVDYAGISAGATGLNNASGDATALDANWSSGSNNSTNLIALEQFVSLSPSDGDNYLKPAQSSVVASNGIAPAYATTLVDGSTWSSEIGAKGAASGSSTNLRKKTFDFGRTWQIFSRRKTNTQ